MAGKILVTGDCGYEQYVFIEELPDKQASLHETWMSAKDFKVVDAFGGAGQLFACLGAEHAELASTLHQTGSDAPESIYLLTKQHKRKLESQKKDDKKLDEDPDRELDENPEADGDKATLDQAKVWKIGLAIVAGEKPYCCGPVAPEVLSKDTPIAVLDFHQGWLEHNQELFPNVLAERFFLVRTHDPIAGASSGDPAEKGIWARVRELPNHGPGIWFCPIQDMAGGSLRVPGAWQTQRDCVVNYLRDDPTMWNTDDGWRDAVVVQIANDGALVLGPGQHETLLVFPGDQPGRFRDRHDRRALPHPG
jgi:hypothetical protein